MIAWGKLAKISIFEAIEPPSPSHPTRPLLFFTPHQEHSGRWRLSLPHFTVLLWMSFFLQTLYYLFLHIAEHAKSMGPFCSYPSMICLSLFLCWHVRLLPSAVTQCMENTSIDPIHSSMEGHVGEGLHLIPTAAQAICVVVSPILQEGKLRLQKLKSFAKVTPGRLVTRSLFSAFPHLTSFQSLSF